MWWQHLGGPCAVVAAGQCLFSPNEMQCVGESGPPVVEEWKCLNVPAKQESKKLAGREAENRDIRSGYMSLLSICVCNLVD